MLGTQLRQASRNQSICSEVYNWCCSEVIAVKWCCSAPAAWLPNKRTTCIGIKFDAKQCCAYAHAGIHQRQFDLRQKAFECDDGSNQSMRDVRCGWQW